ncbi:MAG: BrnT family toxin [Polyangiaceae bacterium]
MTVFLDELAVPFEEGEHPDRPVLVGESRLGRTILVVFTERVATGMIRIISARRVAKRERKAYAEEDRTDQALVAGDPRVRLFQG